MATPDRIDPTAAPVTPVQPTQPGQGTDGARRTADGKTFGDVLRTKVAEQVKPATTTDVAQTTPAAEPDALKWSAHATARLRQRGISLDASQLDRISNAVSKAAQKGSKDSLVMMDNVAMVVSVKNKTVITALGTDQAKDNVFTNIDSAVIA